MKLWASLLLCSGAFLGCRTTSPKANESEAKNAGLNNPGGLHNKKMLSAPDASGNRFNINVSYQTNVEGVAGSITTRTMYITKVFIDISAPHLTKDHKLNVAFSSRCGTRSAETENPQSQGEMTLTTFEASNNMFTGTYDRKILVANGRDLSACTGEISVSINGQWLVDPVADRNRHSGHNFIFHDPFQR